MGNRRHCDFFRLFFNVWFACFRTIQSGPVPCSHSLSRQFLWRIILKIQRKNRHMNAACSLFYKHFCWSMEKWKNKQTESFSWIFMDQWFVLCAVSILQLICLSGILHIIQLNIKGNAFYFKYHKTIIFKIKYK